jgi:hypothetical protein
MALRLREKVRLEDQAIDVQIYAMAHSEIGSEPAKWDPRTRETADHSLPYMLAIALRDGRITPASFEPERYLDPSLRPIMNRIRVAESPEFTQRFPQELRSQIEVTTRAGQRFTERAEYPKGHARNPVTDADVESKFRDLAGDALGAQRARRFTALGASTRPRARASLWTFHAPRSRLALAWRLVVHGRRRRRSRRRLAEMAQDLSRPRHREYAISDASTMRQIWRSRGASPRRIALLDAPRRRRRLGGPGGQGRGVRSVRSCRGGAIHGDPEAAQLHPRASS